MIEFQMLRKSFLFGPVWISLITENWKYCNKIIFKCVNNVVRLSFEENLFKFVLVDSVNSARNSQKKRRCTFLSFLSQSKPSLCIVIAIKSSLRENKITMRKINKHARVVVQCFCLGGTWFGILPTSLASKKDLT